MKKRLEARRDEMHRLVEFYRLSDEAERLAFLEYDDEATDAFEEALGICRSSNTGASGPTRCLRRI